MLLRDPKQECLSFRRSSGHWSIWERTLLVGTGLDLGVVMMSNLKQTDTSIGKESVYSLIVLRTFYPMEMRQISSFLRCSLQFTIRAEMVSVVIQPI